MPGTRHRNADRDLPGRRGFADPDREPERFPGRLQRPHRSEPTGAAPTPGNFVVQIPVTGTTSAFPPVLITNASVVVSSVQCEGIVTTTTTVPSSTSSTTTTMPGPVAGCGDPGGNGIKAGDALYVLLAAVGLEVCDKCICDADGNDRLAASDALRVLQFAVGIDVDLLCPVCSN
jgi:hypothetical protein